MLVVQLGLPLQCRKTVFQLAHEVPFAGHSGGEKTARKMLQRFKSSLIKVNVDADSGHRQREI